MIDLHCHLLPGIDDGPATTAEAVALARAFVAAGVTRVAATPHVEPKWANTADTIHAAWLELVGALGRERVPLEVVTGGELDLLHIQGFGTGELDRLRLGIDGPLLVECPFSAVVPQFEALVGRLLAAGYGVLLAHPERSPAFLRDPELLRRLVVGQGAMASVTGASYGGRFGRTAQQYACWALDEGLVHDVASDAHDVARRPPVLDGPLDAAGYGWAVEWLTETAPSAILAGRELPRRPMAPAQAPGGWARVKRALGGR
ncbi:MAG TPA: CpsB/CapC family capsule biosynthesis tyrosine phosphatase [Baekduia sp.]|nr:CpsB/CapC family capsule biosynthesis tyrosine phosphatase [Baekduia sp.]